MAVAGSHSTPSSPPELYERDEAIRHAKQRLTHLEIEAHRIKAELARLEAYQEDDKADRLANSIGEPAVQIERDDSPAIFRLDLTEREHPVPIEPSAVVAEPRQSSSSAPSVKTKSGRASAVARKTSRTPSVVSAHSPTTIRPSFRKKFAWRKSPPWLLSVLLHAAVLLVAMLCTFATFEESAVFLTANSMQADENAIPELAELELEPVQIEDAELDDLPEEIAELSEDNLFAEDLLSPLASNDAAQFQSPVAVDLLASDLGALMAGMPVEGAGSGGAGGGKRGTGATEASFFGAKSRGNRFVFLVDNSGSMVDGRMETTLIELQRSVESLKEDQFFSIIFYSDQVYPLFYPEPATKLVPATRENKLKVASWLPTVEMCLGGRLREAIELASEMDPQVVYLLSDGDIRSEPLMRHLTEPNDWKFSIHTFGMTVRNPDHLAKLRAIANSHQGQFVPVSIHPAAVQMARQRPIKYNREPGPVWGTKVRPWN